MRSEVSGLFVLLYTSIDHRRAAEKNMLYAPTKLQTSFERMRAEIQSQKSSDEVYLAKCQNHF